MKDIRGPHCATDRRPGKLLLRATVEVGEIKCPRCGAIIKLHIDETETEPIRRTKT